MPIYKVTACYYDEVEVEAESEVDAERKARDQFSQNFSQPDDILVEELSDDYDDDDYDDDDYDDDDYDDDDEEWTK